MEDIDIMKIELQVKFFWSNQ